MLGTRSVRPVGISVVVAAFCAVSCAKGGCSPANATCAADGRDPDPSPLTEPRLVVTSTRDAIDGDVRSPAHLVAKPGGDGITLREAIKAVNSATVPFEITFSPTMVGKTIVLGAPLPFLRNNGATVLGLNGSDGRPAITVSGAQLASLTKSSLTIAASNVRVARLRFVDVAMGNSAVQVFAGEATAGDEFGGPQEITNVRIEDNQFDNSPRAENASAVRLETHRMGSSTRIAQVVIARNSFTAFKGGGSTVMILGTANRGTIEGVDIHDNQFTDCWHCIELPITDASDHVIRDTRIVRNTFTAGNAVVVALNIQGTFTSSVSSRNTITRTLLSENRFTDNRRNILVLNGGGPGATGSTISATWFLNNIVAGNKSGVLLFGGDGGAMNRVESVRIVHSTFYGTAGPALEIRDNDHGGTGNVVADVLVTNSIFWNSVDMLGVAAGQVRNSITTQAPFAGIDGNINADPLFTAPGAGDFHLQAGSPAIDRGTTQCPVAMDYQCSPRTGAPDLGALEFGAAPGSCGSALPAFPQSCAIAALSGAESCVVFRLRLVGLVEMRLQPSDQPAHQLP